jgi:G3E family GTPase
VEAVLCCGSLETFVEAVGTIKVPPRGVLLIEANGTADPMQMIEVLTLRPEASARFWSPMQITIVDAQRWGTRGPLAALEWEQLATATHFFVSRGDEVDEARYNGVRLQAAMCGGRARESTPALIAEELAVLVRADAAPARSVCPSKKRLLTTAGQFAEVSAHQHNPDGSRAFTSMTIDLGQRIWRRDLDAFLAGLPDCVLRVKGLCRLADDPSTPYSFQHVRPQAETRFLALEGYNDLLVEYGIPALPMVGIIIGVRLPEADIRAASAALFKPATAGCS